MASSGKIMDLLAEDLPRLKQRIINKCGYSLGYECVERLMKPEMLETFIAFEADWRKEILMFIGSAEKLWAKHSEALLRAYLKTVVAKWGEEHLLVVVGGNDGKGTTFMVTKILAKLYPRVRLFSIIPVVNKETRRAVCGMGVSTYEQDALDRSSFPTQQVDEYMRPVPDGLQRDKIRTAEKALKEMEGLPIGIGGLLRDAKRALTDYVSNAHRNTLHPCRFPDVLFPHKTNQQCFKLSFLMRNPIG